VTIGGEGAQWWGPVIDYIAVRDREERLGLAMTSVGRRLDSATAAWLFPLVILILGVLGVSAEGQPGIVWGTSALWGGGDIADVIGGVPCTLRAAGTNGIAGDGGLTGWRDGNVTPARVYQASSRFGNFIDIYTGGTTVPPCPGPGPVPCWLYLSSFAVGGPVITTMTIQETTNYVILGINPSPPRIEAWDANVPTPTLRWSLSCPAGINLVSVDVVQTDCKGRLGTLVTVGAATSLPTGPGRYFMCVQNPAFSGCNCYSSDFIFLGPTTDLNNEYLVADARSIWWAATSYGGALRTTGTLFKIDQGAVTAFPGLGGRHVMPALPYLNPCEDPALPPVYVLQSIPVADGGPYTAKLMAVDQLGNQLASFVYGPTVPGFPFAALGPINVHADQGEVWVTVVDAAGVTHYDEFTPIDATPPFLTVLCGYLIPPGTATATPFVRMNGNRRYNLLMFPCCTPTNGPQQGPSRR